MSSRARGSSGPVVELEFAFDDSDYPFVTASDAGDCEIELEEIVPRGTGIYAEFYSVRGAPLEIVERIVNDSPAVTLSVIEHYDDGGLVEFLVDDTCPAVGLAELGALPRTVRGDHGTGQIVAELPAGYDVHDVVTTFRTEYGGELVAKRERAEVTPLFSHREFDRTLERRLTERQLEVLRAAFEAGYYDWPREISCAALADQLGISQPTLSEHLTTAERKLLGVLFRE